MYQIVCFGDGEFKSHYSSQLDKIYNKLWVFNLPQITSYTPIPYVSHCVTYVYGHFWHALNTLPNHLEWSYVVCTIMRYAEEVLVMSFFTSNLNNSFFGYEIVVVEATFLGCHHKKSTKVA